jgi:hypothetical protein
VSLAQFYFDLSIFITSILISISNVLHAGVYYKPGSLKAKLCVEGLQLSYKYFDEKNIPYKKIGKIIVATNKVEEERLKVSVYFCSLSSQQKFWTCPLNSNNLFGLSIIYFFCLSSRNFDVQPTLKCQVHSSSSF